LREVLEAGAKDFGAELYIPPLSLCGDNAAMIGAQAYHEYIAGNIADMRLNAWASLPI
jgi:N6-L-threonylcarbamoyladenine synthase